MSQISWRSMIHVTGLENCSAAISHTFHALPYPSTPHCFRNYSTTRDDDAHDVDQTKSRRDSIDDICRQLVYASIRCLPWAQEPDRRRRGYACQAQAPEGAYSRVYPRLRASAQWREIWWIFMIQYIALQHVRRGNRIQHDTRFKTSVNYTGSKKGFNMILQIPSRP